MPRADLLASLSAVNHVPSGRLDELRRQLGSDYEIHQLDGTRVRDAPSFFNAASTQMFGGERVSNWDSFGDVLRNMVVSSDHPHHVLIWTHAEQMLDGHLGDLQTATEIFTGLSREMNARHTSFTTFLAGAGPNFE